MIQGWEMCLSYRGRRGLKRQKIGKQSLALPLFGQTSNVVFYWALNHKEGCPIFICSLLGHLQCHTPTTNSRDPNVWMFISTHSEISPCVLSLLLWYTNLTREKKCKSSESEVKGWNFQCTISNERSSEDMSSHRLWNVPFIHFRQSWIKCLPYWQQDQVGKDWGLLEALSLVGRLFSTLLRKAQL